MGGPDAAEQKSVDFTVSLLQEVGPTLECPTLPALSCRGIHTCANFGVQHEGRPYRVLYAFDPRRAAILLIGGDKTGNNRWYEEYVPRADRIYDQHLLELGDERAKETK